MPASLMVIPLHRSISKANLWSSVEEKLKLNPATKCYRDYMVGMRNSHMKFYDVTS